MEHLIEEILWLQDKGWLRGFVFGLVPLLIIPFLDRYVVKSKHHIAIGDHDDLKKDLKAKHK